MSVQSVLLAVSGRVGIAVDETKLSPGLQKRLGELQTTRGFLDRISVEVGTLGRKQEESSRILLVPGIIGLLVVFLGAASAPLILPGMFCLGLAGILYFTTARPVEQSLARKKRELGSITTFFNEAIDRTSKEVARELSSPTGWPSNT